MNLINSLIKEGYLKTPRIIEAFQKIKREDFIAGDVKNLAEIDEALPIGFSQTISQPAVVAFMLENLQPKPGQKILDIGSGSGWTTALLAYIVSGGKENLPVLLRESCVEGRNIAGRVIAIEIIPELKDFGEKNVAKYNFIKEGTAEFICADGSRGYEKEASYDRILVSAAVQNEIPNAWRKQLKINGRIVAPVKNSIWVIIKKSESDFKEIEYSGFIFVPLIEE